MNSILKKEKGYVGCTRFVCKSEYDMFMYFRFADLDSLKAYMGSETKTSALRAARLPAVGRADASVDAQRRSSL
jgi:antibiotic biosynthesis monooxygenase (ABM) superfamily enzyme